VFSATSPAVFQRQIRRLDLPGVIDMVDATGEGWAFHSEYIARRSVGRIIAEVAALAAYAQPNKTPQRTGARVARLGP
jgi:hypothetical protein